MRREKKVKKEGNGKESTIKETNGKEHRDARLLLKSPRFVFVALAFEEKKMITKCCQIRRCEKIEKQERGPATETANQKRRRRRIIFV